MKKTKFLTSLILLTSTIGITFGAVPDYYKANYTILNDWGNIKKIFVEIDANNQIGEQTPAESFLSLNNSFNNIFPRFPQEYNFQVTYQKCLTLTPILGNGAYDYDLFSSFMNNCFKPLSKILNTIDTSYTVKPNIVATPTNGPVPLTVNFTV